MRLPRRIALIVRRLENFVVSVSPLRALLNTEIAHCSVRRTDGSRGGAKARPCSSHVLASPEAIGLPLLGLILIYVY
jgi:hypothetical protein